MYNDKIFEFEYTENNEFKYNTEIEDFDVEAYMKEDEMVEIRFIKLKF